MVFQTTLIFDRSDKNAKIIYQIKYFVLALVVAKI